MKVILDNYSDTDTIKTYQIKCDRCSSVLVCNDDDVYNDYWDDLDYIICPLCHHKIYLTQTLIS